MPSRPSKRRPRDPNQLAKHVVELATGQLNEPDDAEVDPVREAARLLGRRGGQKGGKARAAKLTPTQRSEAGRRAAESRWKKKPRT